MIQENLLFPFIWLNKIMFIITTYHVIMFPLIFMLFHIFYTVFQREHSNCSKNLAKADTEHNSRAVKTKSDFYSHKAIVTYLQFYSKPNVFLPETNSYSFVKVCLASKQSICLKNAAIINFRIYLPFGPYAVRVVWASSLHAWMFL